MKEFVYFLPGAGIINAERLKESGLDGRIDPGRETQRSTTAGPGGGAGTLLTRKAMPVYAPGSQKWEKSRNGKFYVGMETEAPPGAEDLRREVLLTGHKVRLADGGEWTVPVARIFTGGSGLPQRLMLGENNEVIETPLPRFIEFSARVEKLWQDFIQEGVNDYSPLLGRGERLGLAIEALALNYRIGIEEANMLGLIESQSLVQVLQAVLDLPTAKKILEYTNSVKKNGLPQESQPQ